VFLRKQGPRAQTNRHFALGSKTIKPIVKRALIASVLLGWAAFDRAFSTAAYAAKQRELPASANPQPADTASIPAFRAFLNNTEQVRSAIEAFAASLP
jgi:hypothetical protein